MILRYELRTHHPTRTGNHYVIVDDDGAIRAHQNLRDPAPGEAWTVAPADAQIGQLEDPRAQIEAALHQAGFFDLPPLTESVTTQGGVLRTLTFVAADGAERTVTVDRARAPAFDAVVRQLLDALAITDLPAR
jgi:hypothetical protein